MESLKLPSRQSDARSARPRAQPLKEASGLVIALTLLAISSGLSYSSAQSEPQAWSAPLNLFETTGRASEPEVVADPSGTLHVFWAYGAPGEEDSGAHQAIYHVSQTDGSWSQPVDVLTSPGGRVARMHSVLADEEGYLHIVWSGGNTIYHSRVYALEASSVRAWRAPTALVSGVTVLEPDIAVDGQGGLYIVWTQARAGLMFTRSDDGGTTWSQPRVAFPSATDTDLARWGRIAVDDASRLHLVLTHAVRDPNVSAGSENPNFLYYLRSEDQGETWSEPFQIVDSPDFGEVNVVAFGRDEIHLAWNGRAGRKGRYHRWSTNGGKTWSAIDEIAGPEDRAGSAGLTGFPVVLTDSAGATHIIFNGGQIYSSSWLDGTWSNPLLISGDVDGCGVTREHCQMEDFSATLSAGNQLHAVFHDGLERIWYVTRQVDAPPREPRSLPTAKPDTVLAAMSTAAPARTATPSTSSRPDLARTPGTQESAQTPLWPVAIGAASALTIVAVAILLNQGRARGR